MALPTSGSINLTAIRDFYGLSGSINLTNLHKGENNVANPATYAVSNFTYVAGTNDGRPISIYDNGGVVPSLDTEANQNIPESGSIDLTDYYGGYKIVNPTVTNPNDGSSGVYLSSYAAQVGRWSGNSMRPDLANGGYASNYQDANSAVSYRYNFGQLVTIIGSAYGGGTYTGHTEVQFKLSHAGIYTLEGIHGGTGTNGGYISLTGTGVSIKVGNRSNRDASDYNDGDSVSGNIYINLNSHLYLEATLPAATTLTMRAQTTSGSDGDYMFCQLRTNCNYNRADSGGTSSSAPTNNNMLTQG
jgi:hypothetical protein|tara:strand:- start:13654 stop:14559 length:906 start_codon:yes stop_codon:yes gene_type:complete